MSETVKKKRSSFITKVFPGRWCWLVTPCTQWSEDGEYSVDLVVPVNDGRELLKMVEEEVHTQAKRIRLETPKAKDWKLSWPIKDDLNPETGEVNTANKVITFKQKIKPGFDFRVDCFDAKNNPIKPGSLRVGNGTKLRINFSVRVVADNLNSRLGILFHPRFAQIVELIPWEANHGFEATDGFVAEESSEPAKHILGTRPPKNEAEDPFASETDPEFTDDGIPF